MWATDCCQLVPLNAREGMNVEDCGDSCFASLAKANVMWRCLHVHSRDSNYVQ